MDIIQSEKLTRKFNNILAVDHLDIKIKKGEIFGLLGPNGAGKTTLISMLTTLLLPTSGSAKICGFDLIKQADKIRGCIGLVFQESILDEELTAYDNLDFHARLYKIPKNQRIKRIDEVLKLMELEDRKKSRVNTFSGGMKKRLEITKGLIHHPKVLFLDEPTLGLDPKARRIIWKYISNLNKIEKITIILTTHYMEEADELCDRIGIINKGKLLITGTQKKLKNSIKKHINDHKPTLEDVFLHYTGDKFE